MVNMAKIQELANKIRNTLETKRDLSSDYISIANRILTIVDEMQTLTDKDDLTIRDKIRFNIKLDEIKELIKNNQRSIQ